MSEVRSGLAVWRFAMVDDEKLRAKLAKVEALFRGPPVRASAPRPRWTGCKAAWAVRTEIEHPKSN